MPTTEIRRHLATCLSKLEVVRETERRSTFRGVIHADEELVGPPGRLHGGLHAAVRLLMPFEQLTSKARVEEELLAMDLRMRRGIALSEDVPIEGSFEISATGAATLRTRTDGTDRLDAELRTGVEDVSKGVLARFRSALDEDRRSGERTTIVGNGNLEVGVGPNLVSIGLDPAYAAREEIRLVRFLAPGKTVDPVFACVALDVIGAYALGMNLDARLFTTRLSLTTRGVAPVRGDGFLVLGDRRSVDVEGSTLEKVDVRGRMIGEQRVEVLLADAALERAYGYGCVSLVPVRAA